MSDDQLPETVSPVLRREALLPTERSRGLGTVAVVCTMAGVASGLALATTLMAMQVADSMSTHACPYMQSEAAHVELRQDHGFLGILYSKTSPEGAIKISRVYPGTPAEAIALRPGDRLLSIDGDPMTTAEQVQERIFEARPGSMPTIVIERDGAARTLRPTLASYPTLSY